jgi:hypothetical protein
MNTYRVWISSQKRQTLVTRQFKTSFAARLWIADVYGLKVTDAVAERVEPTTRVDAPHDPTTQ